MSEAYWEERYRLKDTPWDKGQPSPGLVDFLQQNTADPRQRVAIPGCGMGHDARAWAEAGFDAHGFDISASAVALCAECDRNASLPVRFARCDFLGSTPEQPFDWLFEHTLFCAIQPDLRDAYVHACTRWIRPGGNFLAVHYLIPDTEGPPFGTTREEIIARFSPHFELIRDWVPRSYENRTGLERMFHWRKPAVSS